MSYRYDRKKLRWVVASTVEADTTAGILADIDYLQTHYYAPMVFGGFHADVLTTTAQPKLPRLVCMTNGRLMMTRYTHGS